MTGRGTRVLSICAAWLLAGALAPAAAPAVTPLADIEAVLQPRWGGYQQPLYVTAPRDGSGRLFVVEKRGVVKVIDDGVQVHRAYLDMRGLVSTNGERGLLGLAFAPDFKTSGRFYVNYTDLAGDTVVARYTATPPSSNTPSLAGPQVVLKVDRVRSNHNGGCLQFGRDGYLYISSGDGAAAGDPSGNARNPALLLGKILRIDTGDSPRTAGLPKPATYRIPPDNPFVGRPGWAPEIWALGLRNPWRFSFDRMTGDVWIADVGQNAWEEIDFVGYRSRSGRDFGWSLYEGTHAYPPGSVPAPAAGLTFPIVEHAHPQFESITGGYVYRGTRYPAYTGAYLYADFITGRLMALRRSAAGVSERRQLLDTTLNIASFGEDAAGEVYLCAFNGWIYRLASR